MLAELISLIPLFAPFADARFSDFTKIHFWKSRMLNLLAYDVNAIAPGSSTMARLRSLANHVGKGSLFVLASGWQPRATNSQFALSSKFVPLLYSLLELSGAIKAQSLDFHIGDPVDVSSLACDERPDDSQT